MCFSIALFFFILLSSVASADMHTSHHNLLPKIPAAKGEQCVEPTEVMRRRHMDFILHQRDRTVHEGIRTEKHRFVNCIDCHVQARADGSYPRHTDADHFCESCHRFSSVKMDCFQCHADRPAEAYSELLRRYSRAGGDPARSNRGAAALYSAIDTITRHLSGDD